MPAKKIIMKKATVQKNESVITKLQLSLPTEKNVPSVLFDDYSTLLYGVKKIGKSSLVANFPDILQLFFEPGGKSLASFQCPVPIWEHFIGYIDLLEQQARDGVCKFRNIAIDTGQLAYDRCLEYVCRVRGVQHPSNVDDYGATWKAVSQEFEKQHTRLFAMNLGVIVVAHSEIREIKSRSGNTFSKIVLLLGKQASQFYAGIFDNIFFYDYDDEKRFLYLRGNDLVDAGTRCQDNFLTLNGERVERIPMGDSADEAYKNLVKAFNNKQANPYKRKEDVEKKKKVIIKK